MKVSMSETNTKYDPTISLLLLIKAIKARTLMSRSPSHKICIPLIDSSPSFLCGTSDFHVLLGSGLPSLPLCTPWGSFLPHFWPEVDLWSCSFRPPFLICRTKRESWNCTWQPSYPVAYTGKTFVWCSRVAQYVWPPIPNTAHTKLVNSTSSCENSGYQTLHPNTLVVSLEVSVTQHSSHTPHHRVRNAMYLFFPRYDVALTTPSTSRNVSKAYTSVSICFLILDTTMWSINSTECPDYRPAVHHAVALPSELYLLCTCSPFSPLFLKETISVRVNDICSWGLKSLKCFDGLFHLFWGDLLYSKLPFLAFPSRPYRCLSYSLNTE